MNLIEEEDLQRRLARLGAIQPAPEATERSLARVRRALLSPVPDRGAVPQKAPRLLGSSRGAGVRWKQFTIAAAIVAAVCVPLAWFVFAPSSAIAGFEDVQAAMRARRSVSCRHVERVAGAPDAAGRWQILGDGRFRIERPDGSFTVVDAARRQILSVDIGEREATLFNDGTPPPVNLYEAVKNLPRGAAARELPRTRIAGKDVQGFVVSVDDQELTVWTDPGVRLPVRIEADTQTRAGLAARLTIDGFEYDKPLDAQLFALTPPADFAFAKIGSDELRGRWERTIAGSKPLLQEVLVVEGDHDTFTLQKVDGRLVRKLTARVRLERAGDVLIYNRDSIRLVEGNLPPGGLPETQSFIYKFDRDGLVEVSGVLNGRKGSWPRPAVMRWQGPGKRRDLPMPEESVEKPAAADDPDLVRDLEQLQGRWERIGRNAQREITMHQEKLIEGNVETLMMWDPEGTLINRRSSRFRLEKHGPVRIYHVSETKVEIGHVAWHKEDGEFASVYLIDGQTLLDTPGLFQKRVTYQNDPTIYVWTRKAADGETTKEKSP